MRSLICLRAAQVSVLLVADDEGLPRVLHWGADTGPVSAAEFETLAAADRMPVSPNSLDQPLVVGIVPEQRFGWLGSPGLIGSRDGLGWSPDWRIVSVAIDARPVDGFVASGPALVEYTARAGQAGLELRIAVELLPTGLVRARATVVNTGEPAYRVDELTVRFPVPAAAREVLDFAGRWGNERVPQRTRLGVGAHRREGRRGRTGADATFVLSLGEEGFGYQQGEIWACHTAWSGNHLHLAERDPSGAQVIGGGELLLPGEGTLGSGQSYTSPWVYFNHAVGLDAQAARFHQHLRGLPVHPRTRRPVTLNVWEAVYFDQNADRLIALAEQAAELGIERYVLDDGWFGSRRDDRSGMGDWVVSPQVWPHGLHPLVNRVKELGLEFGLWFEPEMVNLDSELARAHPDWIMQPGGRLPIESRHQQVLNLSIPEAFQHILGQVSAILTEYPIDYVKWDHNRDLTDAGTAPLGQPAIAAQTRAFYRLLDELRRRHPRVEFESCSSGGSRIDLEVLERVERVWVSDTIDPQERQRMLWWTGQLLPPELMGSHIASGRSHTTGRRHDLDFRAATAVFGHLGVEWDLASATSAERAELRRWIDWYKDNRETLHSGRLVRIACADPEVYFKGIIAADRAIFSLAVLRPSPTISLGRLRFPGLDPDARHRVRLVNHQPLAGYADLGSLLATDGIVATGRQLAAVGIRAPYLRPDTAAVFLVDKLS